MIFGQFFDYLFPIGYLWWWLTPLIPVLDVTFVLMQWMLFITECHLCLNPTCNIIQPPWGEVCVTVCFRAVQRWLSAAEGLWGTSHRGFFFFFSEQQQLAAACWEQLSPQKVKLRWGTSLFGPVICFTTAREVYSRLCSHSAGREWVSLPREELSWAGNVLWEDEGTVPTTTDQQLTHWTVKKWTGSRIGAAKWWCPLIRKI